jgi:predicted O-methyltransferase YrrM
MMLSLFKRISKLFHRSTHNAATSAQSSGSLEIKNQTMIYTNFTNENLPKDKITSLLKRYPWLGKRNETFRVFLEKAYISQNPLIVEFGSIRNLEENFQRGDGHSSILFSDAVTNLGGTFYTIDEKLKCTELTKQVISSYTGDIHALCDKECAFLDKLPKRIDALYLDISDDPAHTLQLFLKLEQHLEKNAVILIDDFNVPNKATGKGDHLVIYLLKRNWTILKKGYQIVLVRE